MELFWNTFGKVWICRLLKEDRRRLHGVGDEDESGPVSLGRVVLDKFSPWKQVRFTVKMTLA